MPYSYRSLTMLLAAGGADDPADEARLLLEHFTGVPLSEILSDREKLYDHPALEVAVQKRQVEHIPLQYLLGEWDFFGCRFAVNEHCLIPRPDTEILVEEAIRLLPSNAHFADLCTGSGCVAVATLVHRPDTQAVALELFPETLALAMKNARSNHVEGRMKPLCADLLSGAGREALAAHAPYDAILSNPPYIRTADLAGLSLEVHKEPAAALDGGEDGLCFYRAILQDYAPLVRAGGYILLEIGYDQAEDIRTLAATTRADITVTIKQDLGGRDRVAILQIHA